MIIRKMMESDLEQVAAIEADSFSRPWSKEAFADSMELANYIFVVAEEDEDIIGYCGLVCTVDEGDITSIAVKRECRGRHVGSVVLQGMIEAARHRGVKAMTLEVRVSNSPAISLYESAGFVSSGSRKNFYVDPKEDAVIMWKEDL